MHNTANSSDTPADYRQVMAAAQCIMEHLKLYGMENPRVFQIDGTQTAAVKNELYKAGISFLELKDKNCILVEQSDYMRCSQIANHAYLKQRCFLQEYDEKELEKIVADHPKITNKAFLQIKNLSPAEAELFLNCCNKIKPGLLLETYNQEHGEYTVSIPHGLLSKQERENIVAAYIESSISAFGTNFIARKKEDFTKENYEAQLKEHHLAREIISAINKKLETAGLSGDNFNEYFKSASRQTAYVLTQLQNGQEMAGFSENQQEALQSAYKELPENTFRYTADKMKRHEISSKEALKTKQMLKYENMLQKPQYEQEK